MLPGLGLVRRAQEPAAVRPGGAEQTFKFQAGHHVGVAVTGETPGRRRTGPGSQDEGPGG